MAASTPRPEMLGFRVTPAERREIELAALGEGHELLAPWLRRIVLEQARARLRIMVESES